MKTLLINSALSLVLGGSAFAAGTHSGDHSGGHASTTIADHGHDMMAVGTPGGDTISRTVEVSMKETDDGMVFEPASLEFAAGETVKFVLTNAGELEHEFVMDTADKNQEHKVLMAKMDMEHDDPNSIRLDPGAEGEIVWTFSNAGTFEFACLIPGHYESGMHGPITVN
ncbi:plastocyanin/azurin family copper-binding protein [Puniceibacterium confluentis]|uniref:plastocyanin/azurin family copper-binding protein n=1 Tax=Puniceibacterium confluentis TaxID=1958944 RepID=UPI0011B4E88D